MLFYSWRDLERDSRYKEGCFFVITLYRFDESEYINVPSIWSPNILSLKTFSTSDSDGRDLWDTVNDRLVFRQATNFPVDSPGIMAETTDLQPEPAQFGKPQLVNRVSVRAPSGHL